MIAVTFADPWRFVPNPEVYVLVAFLVGAYVYAVRVIGPTAVRPGQQVVTRKQIAAFVGAMVLLFTASTWPIHQIGEDYLYSIHMLQHMMLSYFMPPLILLATPEWLARLLIGEGQLYRTLRFLTRPVVAGIVFNMLVMVTHIPGVVNASVRSAPLHYLLHVLVVVTAIWMWFPVLGPFREWQMTPLGKCFYLFAQSVVPMVPAGWLTFAEGTVYRQYQQPVRVWGMSITADQQLAGAIMKTGGTLFVWAVILGIWIRRCGVDDEPRLAGDWSGASAPPAGAGTGTDVLTYEQVTEAFDRSPTR